MKKYRSWCEKVAELAADALVDKNCITKPNFNASTAIIAEEIFVRLISGDYLSPCNPKRLQ